MHSGKETRLRRDVYKCSFFSVFIRVSVNCFHARFFIWFMRRHIQRPSVKCFREWYLIRTLVRLPKDEVKKKHQNHNRPIHRTHLDQVLSQICSHQMFALCELCIHNLSMHFFLLIHFHFVLSSPSFIHCIPNYIILSTQFYFSLYNFLFRFHCLCCVQCDSDEHANKCITSWCVCIHYRDVNVVYVAVYLTYFATLQFKL